MIFINKVSVITEISMWSITKSTDGTSRISRSKVKCCLSTW